MADKQLYRITIQLDAPFANVPASVMFIGAATQEIAEAGAVEAFHKALVQNGTPNATYTKTVALSSYTEVEEYIKNRDLGHTTHRTVS